MPFTPIHMGPGLLIKAVLQSSFSLMVFGWTQIVMDIQPLLVMLHGEGHVHGFTHTYFGATLVAIFAALTGKYLSEFGLKILEIEIPNSGKIAWGVCILSAFIGSYSHVLLDSIMHSDLEPFYPFVLSNNMHRIISVMALHKFCFYCGVIGAGIYYGFLWWRKEK
jgi:membrane-bound metal-dependent hydrolase YbcI (DUF457 family)